MKSVAEIFAEHQARLGTHPAEEKKILKAAFEASVSAMRKDEAELARRKSTYEERYRERRMAAFAQRWLRLRTDKSLNDFLTAVGKYRGAWKKNW